MYNLFQNVTKNDLRLEPYPHIVIYDALPKELCDKLANEFPDINVITKNASPGSNKRFNYSTVDILKMGEVSHAWVDYVNQNTTQDFFSRFVDIFGEEILKEYPNFEEQHAPLDKFKLGVWQRDLGCHGYINVAADVNTPVLEKPSTQRGPHLDQPKKLLFGLLYLRQEHDESTGGDLEIYRFKNNRDFRFERTGRHIDNRYIDLVNVVKYERNVMVIGLNSIRAVHAVSERAVTSIPRCFSNFFIELNKPLFDPNKQTSL